MCDTTSYNKTCVQNMQFETKKLMAWVLYAWYTASSFLCTMKTKVLLQQQMANEKLEVQ